MARSDWGLQACQLDDPNEVHLNTVGTFGIASAGYYWSRALAVISRVLLVLMMQDPLWQLVYVDDYSWLFCGGRFEEMLWFTLF